MHLVAFILSLLMLRFGLCWHLNLWTSGDLPESRASAWLACFTSAQRYRPSENTFIVWHQFRCY
jgi:hypothetical protein